MFNLQYFALSGWGGGDNLAFLANFYHVLFFSLFINDMIWNLFKSYFSESRELIIFDQYILAKYCIKIKPSKEYISIPMFKIKCPILLEKRKVYNIHGRTILKQYFLLSNRSKRFNKDRGLLKSASNYIQCTIQREFR